MKYYHAALFLLILTISGCRNKYYSEGDFSSVLKIDSHVHINSNKGYFEEAGKQDNFILITLGVDHGDSANIRKQHDDAILSVTKFPGRVFYGPAFHFDTAGWRTDGWSRKVISQLDKDISGGAVTVKIWKNIGMTVHDRSGKFIMVDDPGLDQVIEFIINKGLPVTGHLGEPRNCWLSLDQMTVSSDSSYFAGHPEYHMYLHPEYPSYEDQINARDNLLKKHAGLRFIGCHLASLEWNVDSLAKRLDRFPDMAVDMSARICHLQYQSARDRKRVRDFCIKYRDRLLYGTDTGDSGNSDPADFKKNMHETWLDDWRYFTTDEEMRSDKFRGKFKGLKLPKDVVDKIYSENAIKWYKLNISE
jgi:hypothetical protein